jgi:hypothetical protein
VRDTLRQLILEYGAARIEAAKPESVGGWKKVDKLMDAIDAELNTLEEVQPE